MDHAEPVGHERTVPAGQFRQLPGQLRLFRFGLAGLLGSNRTFSSSTTSPSPSVSAALAWSPTTSLANGTSVPSSSPSRAATGRREYAGSGAPSLPTEMRRHDHAAPASANARMVGNAARTRPSSVIFSPSSGMPRSAHEHAPTGNALAEQVVERLHRHVVRTACTDELDQVCEGGR